MGSGTLRCALATTMIAASVATTTTTAQAADTAYITTSTSSNSYVDVLDVGTRTVGASAVPNLGSTNNRIGLAISPAGTRGFYPESSTGKLRTFLVPGATTLATLDGVLRQSATGLAPGANRFLVGYEPADDTNRVAGADAGTGVLNGSSPQIALNNTVDSIAVRTARVAADGSASPELVYVADANGNVVELAPDTLAPTGRTWDFPAISSGQVAVAPDGGTLYGTDGSANNVYAVSLAAGGSSPQAFTDPAGVGIPPNPTDVVATPDGRRVVALAGTGLYVADAATQAWIKRVTLPAAGAAVALTTDGTAAIVPLANGTVRLVDLTSNSYTAVSTNAGLRGAASELALIPRQGPTAGFTATAAGATVAFDGASSADPDGTVATWTWSFGDGTTATTTTPTTSHAYATSGSYTTRLTVTDDEGNSTDAVTDGRRLLRNNGPRATTTQAVAVTVPARPPVVTPPVVTPPVVVRDTKRPTLKLSAPKAGGRYKAAKLRALRGTAKDASGIARVEVSLTKAGKRRCRLLGAGGRLGRKPVSCMTTRYRKAKGTATWSVALKPLPKGRYTLRIRATDAAGNRSKVTTVAFRVG